MAYEEQLSRSSLQVGRWILHELPSISGCDCECRGPSNEAYHGRGFGVRKTTFIAAEFLNSRPLLRVRKTMPKKNLSRIGACLPNRLIFRIRQAGAFRLTWPVSQVTWQPPHSTSITPLASYLVATNKGSRSPRIFR